MAGYQRFVAYVYEYLKGKKGNNCGFIKVEVREQRCRLELHLQCPGIPAKTECRIYGFVRNGGLMDGNLLGTCKTGDGTAQCLIETDALDMNGTKVSIGKMGGLILTTEEGAFFGTEWDDVAIRPENFREVKKSLVETPIVRPSDKKQEENKQKDVQISKEAEEKETQEPQGEETPDAPELISQSLRVSEISRKQNVFFQEENRSANGAREEESMPVMNQDGNGRILDSEKESGAEERNHMSESSGWKEEIMPENYEEQKGTRQSRPESLQRQGSGPETMPLQDEEPKQKDDWGEMPERKDDWGEMPERDADWGQMPERKDERGEMPERDADWDRMPERDADWDRMPERDANSRSMPARDADSRSMPAQDNAPRIMPSQENYPEPNRPHREPPRYISREKTGEAYQPFGDEEITDCRRLHITDLTRLNRRDMALRNNRFLQYGYYNFGHLLLCRRGDGRYILGVPGVYDQQERFMANMFGFPYFKESRYIQLPKGRGGYWYRLINTPDFH